jgi:thiamine-phosphate pyrophosphorylase
MPKVPVERIIDANINRAKEGLRVCEEITRFILNSAPLTMGFKAARHRVDGIVKGLPKAARFIRERDSCADVGRPSDKLEAGREGVRGVFYANIQRAKEAVRVLEEFSKLFSSAAAVAFKRLRYDIYELEKKTSCHLHKI